MIKRYEIAGVGIVVDTETDYQDSAPYADFLKPDGREDICCRFTRGKLPHVEGVRVLGSSSKDIYQSENGQMRFFKDREVPYACSRLPEESKECQVILSEEAPELWGGFVFSTLGLEHLLARRGRIILHASYIEWEGRAILFTAPCQTGKSTQADLWKKYRGAEIINGDRVCLSADDGAVMAHGLPMAGTSGICYNKTRLVAAVVYLSQSPENHLERLRGAAAFRAVYSGNWVNDWEREDAEAVVGTVGRIIAGVPVYHLACRPDKEAVDLLAAALERD